MNFNSTPLSRIIGLVGLCSTLLFSTAESHANVYATNIRLNGGTADFAATNGDTVTITYLLNEPATLVHVQIRSGSLVVRSLDFTEGGQGTQRGFNSVSWDTRTAPVPSGTYSIAVVPTSKGYTNWTQITSDTTDANTYVFDGRGIAVDRNPTSPYYGRIFVANASVGFNPSTTPGDTLGVLKFNADTSDPEDGVASADTGGHDWLGGEVSPWKLEISADDSVYVADMAHGGEVFRWDPTISSNSLQAVLRQDNQPAGAVLSGLAVTGTGAATNLWMTDTNSGRVFTWNVVPATNDSGGMVVNAPVTNFWDVALDPAGNIYTCSFIASEGDSSPRVFRFHAVNPPGVDTTPDWAVGAGNDTYAGASGVAVDPTGAYLAVSFEGPVSTGLFSTNGNTKILSVTNGALVANIDLGLAIQNDTSHDDTDCAWDAVGNLYYIDNYWSRWRAVSPPGTNFATTLALATVQIIGGPVGGSPIQITHLTYSGSTVTIDFTAGPTDSAASFKVQGSSTVNGLYSDVAGAQITQTASGVFRATIPITSNIQYFRIARTGAVTPPPPGTGPSFVSSAVSGSNLLLTFSGSSTDTPGSFTLLSSATVNATYVKVSNPNIIQLSPGMFRASVPMSGPAQFYRLQK